MTDYVVSSTQTISSFFFCGHTSNFSFFIIRHSTGKPRVLTNKNGPIKEKHKPIIHMPFSSSGGPSCGLNTWLIFTVMGMFAWPNLGISFRFHDDQVLALWAYEEPCYFLCLFDLDLGMFYFLLFTRPSFLSQIFGFVYINERMNMSSVFYLISYTHYYA